MTSRVESALDNNNVVKLPDIGEVRSLVSPPQSSRLPSLSDQAATWAESVRQRISWAVEIGAEVDDNDIVQLQQEVISLFITALQEDSRPCWMYLNEVLKLAEPFKDVLQGRLELYHYLERVSAHLQQRKEDLFDLTIEEKLCSLFPKEMQRLQDTGSKPARNYCIPVPPKTTPPKPPFRMVNFEPFKFPDPNAPFLLEREDDDVKYEPKQLTFGDLRKSFPYVAMEIALREAIWSNNTGHMAQTLNIDLLEEEDVPETARRMSPQMATPRTLEVQKKVAKITAKPQQSEELPEGVLSGRDAVEYFAKCYHTGKITYMYFNVAPNRHFRPYDLIAVRKNKAGSEHYVFSTFGVLHVYPNQPAESLSLADWQRQAVLFDATSKIPFFKNYLTFKMFRRWRANMKYAEYARMRYQVKCGLLTAVPSFGAALIQVSRLCQELCSVHILPKEISKMYTLGDFENAVNYINLQAEKVLERFFSYNKLVIDTLSEETFKKLRYCEEQVRQKAVFTKDSLHLQRLKREQREANLKQAKQETSRLGALLKYMDQFLLAHLIKLARSNVVAFIYENMCKGIDAPRDGLFKTSLVFTSKDVLGLSPSKDKFMRTLSRTLTNIPELLCKAAVSMDISYQHHQAELRSGQASPAVSRSDRVPSLASLMKDPKKTAGSHVYRQGAAPHTISSAGRTSEYSAGATIGQLSDAKMSKTILDEKDDIIHTPEIERQGPPSKEEDNLGVATPSLVLRGDMGKLTAVDSFPPYHPISRSSLAEKLANDEQYQRALSEQEKLMKEAVDEINLYCNDNIWLSEIYTFCKNWDDDSVNEWKGATGYTIEQKLNEIRHWIERVRTFDKSYTTENGLFHIDCSGIADSLIPQLNRIFKQLCSFVAKEAAELARKFCDDMHIVLQNMKNKDTSIAAFAVYAKNMTKYKKNTSQYQQKVEYIKSLFEITKTARLGISDPAYLPKVIRMSYRQLSPEEEKLEEGVSVSWEAFLFQIQDAIDFVNTQTPLITQNLEDSYQKLEAEAKALCETATSGKFLDPQQNPTAMLIDMRKIRTRFYTVQQSMHEASKWKEAITGEPYNLDFLGAMASKMDIRQELWKYVEVSTHAIKDWKQLLFRKMNIKKALDKINEWQVAAGQMKRHLPQGDLVLAAWYKMLADFRQDLPLLHKLASDALKPQHWKAIFLGMGEAYDPEHQFTVEELLSYNLSKHSTIINTIYSAAVSEFTVEQKLLKVQRLWSERNFKLAKHIPDSVYKADESRAMSANRKAKRFEKFRMEKAEAAAPRGLNLQNSDLYVLTDVDDLLYQLEDSHVTLQAMLQSPFLSNHRSVAENLDKNLQQVTEVVQLWHTCQRKWMYLLRVFEDPATHKALNQQSVKFEAVHAKFQEFMQSVVSDPKVMSVLTKQRGDKSYRPLQGDRLRNLLSSLIRAQEGILKELVTLLEKQQEEFPRLYFLSNEEMVELLSFSRNPRVLIPFVRKCFSGIESLGFALPCEAPNINASTLDVDLNAHRLEVTTLFGCHGERVPLLERVGASREVSHWLSSLEHAMRTTMYATLQLCVQARLDEGSKQPLQILEELTKYEKEHALQKEEENDETEQKGEIKKVIKETFSHWLLRFPTQCVLTAESILWERGVFRVLEKQDKEELKQQRSNLSARLDQYISVLRENCLQSQSSETRQRLHDLLGSLINQGLYHRDVIDRLLDNESLSDSGYDWLRVLKYHMDVSTVLRAKTEIKEEDVPDNQSATASVVSMTADSRPSTFRSRIMDENPQLPRSTTTVSTGYQFGSCLVHQMGATFSYDHEYLGPHPRLIFTPLTERAYLSMTMALKSFHCGTLMGPAGTGKTETVKDLAMALGRHCVLMNCCEDVTMTMMNRYMDGMIRAGSWVLFSNVDRLPAGLLSVLSQQMEQLCSALRVLDASSDNQYLIRGQPRFDKKVPSKETAGAQRIRRNSLTTLHSLPATDNISLERQATVPHGFNETGLQTYFEEPWVRERERRHSIEKEIEIKESELYKTSKPPPLFYEHVTQHRKPKPDYNKLIPQISFKPTHLGNVMFNGKLVNANASYGCFMTINTVNGQHRKIPHNLKLVMRPCAMVIPDIKVIVEITLYCYGFHDYQILTNKLCLLNKLIHTQMPKKRTYDFGVSTWKTILKMAVTSLYAETQEEKEAGANQDNANAESSLLSMDMNKEEAVIMQAVSALLLSKMEDSADTAQLKSLMRDVFPNSIRPRSGDIEYDPDLVLAIHEQMKQDKLQPTPGHVSKVLQLYTALQLKSGVILTGPAGCGKTSCYRVLCQALSGLHSRQREAEPEKNDYGPSPERGLIRLSKRKLKILHGVEPTESGRVELWRSVAGTIPALNSAYQNVAETAPAVPLPNYPKVDVRVMNPNALTPQEMFGWFEGEQWHLGILTKLLKEASLQAAAAKSVIEQNNDKRSKSQQQQQPPSIIHKCLVLDGTLNPAWADNMNTLLGESHKLVLGSGEQVLLQDTTSLIFEVADLTNASPSIISSCALVHCGKDTVNWKSLVESWAGPTKERWMITASSLQVIMDLTNSVFCQTLTFLTNECTTSLNDSVRCSANQTSGHLQEVMSFLRIFSSLLDRHLLREDFERMSAGSPSAMSVTVTPQPPEGADVGGTQSRLTSVSTRTEDLIPNYMNIIKSMFAFAYIWGFGGHLHDGCIEKFDKFARETLYRATHMINVPDGSTVFDYWVDVKHGTLVNWCDRPLERSRSSVTSYVIIPEIDRYHYLVDLLLSCNHPVLLTGGRGLGKTSLLQNVIHAKHPFTKISMSPGLSSDVLQEMIMIRLNDLRFASAGGIGLPKIQTSTKNSKLLFFLDDLNTASSDSGTGTQPCLELVRQILGHGGVYDKERQVFSLLPEVHFLAACTTPTLPGSGLGTASHLMSPSLTRLFTVLTFYSLCSESLQTVYGKTIQTWLEEFPSKTLEHHFELARAIVQGSLEMFNLVTDKLRPTPAHAHYVFSLHDVAHIVEGMLLLSPRSRSKPIPRQKRRGGKDDTLPPLSLSAMTGTLPMMRLITRLWCHECARVFGDRIVADEDLKWFRSTLYSVTVKYFCTGQQDKMSAINEESQAGDQSEPSIGKGEEKSDLKPPEALLQPMLTPASTLSVDDDDPLLNTRTAAQSKVSGKETPRRSPTPKDSSRKTASEKQSDSVASSKLKSQSSIPSTPGRNSSTSKRTTQGSVNTGKDTYTTAPVESTIDAGSRATEDDSDDEDEDSSSESSEDSSSVVSSEFSADLHRRAPPVSKATVTTKSVKREMRGKQKALMREGSQHTAGDKTITDTISEMDMSVKLDSRNAMNTPDAKISSFRGTGTPGLKRSLSKANMKRGVTFKAGLLTDQEWQSYDGPLLTIEQVKGAHEELTDIMFTKNLLSASGDSTGLTLEKGYVESSGSQALSALRHCLARYNSFTQQKLDMVFFNDAVRHIAKLTRVLALPGGHALLLGMSYCTGRSTLTRLAAFTANCKLFEPRPQNGQLSNRHIVQEYMKRCSRAAAIQGRQVALLVHPSMGDECLEDVCAFMDQGQCPGLYTDEEYQDLASQMTPGQVKVARQDKIDQVMEKFLKRVKQNVHVIICLNYKGDDRQANFSELHTKLQQYPSLLKLCHSVDLYRTWSQEALVHIATVKLQESASVVPWNDHSKAEQMALVSSAMAYIHRSAKIAVDGQYYNWCGDGKFFTPLTFLEFIHVFKVICAHITKEEKEEMQRYEIVLAKITKAHESIAEYKREVSNLVPRHQAALEAVKELVTNVEEQREDYIQALETCKGEEEKIEQLLTPLENMRQDAKAELNKATPAYEAALDALKSLNIQDIEEIKSYRVPPQIVCLVTNAICLLFREKQDWESGKQLLLRENFFHELEFYDKNNIPEDIFKQLGIFVGQKDFQVSLVRKVSKAASGLCQWVHAVYRYAQIYRNVNPKMKNLAQAEEELSKAQAELGQRRVEAHRIKSSLEQKIESHKKATTQAKTIEKQIQSMERKIRVAGNLMENMSMQNVSWKQELRQARSKLRTVPGDALIAAACVCYYGPLNDQLRAELLVDWLERCQIGNFDPSLRFRHEIKPVSLSAKLENLLRPCYSESSHSVTAADNTSHRGDDVSSIHDTERASSTSSIPQQSVYKPRTTEDHFRTEICILDNLEGGANVEIDNNSIEASSTSGRNLLAVREDFSLTEILSSFYELSEWKKRGLPADVHSIHNALILRVSRHNRPHCWPLIVDPDGQAEAWVQELQASSLVMNDSVESGSAQQNVNTVSGSANTREISHSRGTGVTFSDLPEETNASGSLTNTSHSVTPSKFTENESEFTSASQTGPSDTVSQTQEPSSGTLLRGPGTAAVTTLTNISARVKYQVEETLKKPANGLWVVEADSPTLSSKIVNALVHGVAILVTHVERRPLDRLFRNLIQKHFRYDQDGRRTVMFGEDEFAVHPEFSLYLSTSTPLFMKGDGIFTLPIQKLCVVSMSVSQEAIIDRLLYNIMAVERPEFEGQRRSIESDLMQHKHELSTEQELVLEKTLNLKVAILEEKTMLECLITCQKNTERNKTIMEEGLYLRNHLEEKRVHYIPVALSGASLYSIIQHLALVDPLYHVPFSTFLSIFKETLQNRKRGKGGNIGAPKARAQELIDSTTSALYDHTTTMMQEDHSRLFLTMIVICRMKLTQKLTLQEQGLFINGIDISRVDLDSEDLKMDSKPEWLPSKMWVECFELENRYSAYRGLRDSMSIHSKQWKEYFELPVVLVNPLPDEKLQRGRLSVFQKAILWRICCPHRVSDVCEALRVYEFGGILKPSSHYNLNQIYQTINKNIPVVLVQPKQGPISTYPVPAILQLAKDNGMEGRVHIVTFGLDKQMEEAKTALSDCMSTGYWLVLQNAHLSQPWTEEMLELLKSVIGDEETSYTGQPLKSCDAYEYRSNMSLDTVSDTQEGKIHRDFRLWVTTESNSDPLIPGLLIQHAVKVACDLKDNFKSTIQNTYHNLAERQFGPQHLANSIYKQIFGQINYMLPLSFLHAVLLHRGTYGDSGFTHEHDWSNADFASIIDAFKIITAACRRERGILETAELVYTSHCFDAQDKAVVEAIAKDLLLPPKRFRMLPEYMPGVSGLLSVLIPGDDETLEQKLDSLVQVSARTLGLPEAADFQQNITQSRHLLHSLHALCSPQNAAFVGITKHISQPIEQTLEQILDTLSNVPAFPTFIHDPFYPLESYLQAEIHTYKTLADKIKSDTLLLLKMVRGETAETAALQEMITCIKLNALPGAWQTTSFLSQPCLQTWLKDLGRRIELVLTYLKEDSKVAWYRLAAFNRPDVFLQAVLQTHARKHFRDLHTFIFEIQVLPFDLYPSGPPTVGIHLVGLELHNALWDVSRSSLRETQSGHPSSCSMPVIWLKPVETGLSNPSSDTRYRFYSCPVYISKTTPLNSENMVTTFDLPTTTQSPTLWTQKCVHLVTNLDD